MRKRSEVKTKSVFYPSDKEANMSHYVFMLYQDFEHVMPIGGMANRNSEFKVELNGGSKGDIKTLVEALSVEGYRSDLESVVSSFVNKAAQIISYYGDIYYEVSSNPKETDFLIIDIPNYSIWNFFDIAYIQYVPSTSYREKQVILLPTKNIYHLKFPPKLGSTFGYKYLVHRLRQLGKNLLPNFLFVDMQSGKNRTLFDTASYKLTLDLKLAKLTKGIGWDIRGTFNDHITDYYYMYRIIKFHKSKAILRDHIIKNLNRILKEQNILHSRNASIKVSGILSVDDLDEILVRYKNREISTNDALDKILKDL